MISRRDLLIRTAGAAGGLSTALYASVPTAEEGMDPLAGRTLVFDEVFAMLDPEIWHAGRKATTFDSGFYGRSAFARIEGEEGFQPYEIVDDPQTENGKALKISARYIGRKMNVPSYYGNDLPEYQWISGNIQTAKPDGTLLKGWRDGYFEARMWFPAHPLTFPGFWFLNGRSILHPETSIELDIAEHKGFEPKVYGAYLHEWGEPGQHHESIGVPTPVDVTTGYFRYGMLVDGATCSLFFERQRIEDPVSGEPVIWNIGRADEMDGQNDVFWPLITLALLSDVPFPDPLIEEHRQTALHVDYFRVWR